MAGVDGLRPPPPAPLPGWRWYLGTITREVRDADGRLLRVEETSIDIPAASLEEAEQLLAEFTLDGIIDGELMGWLPA